MQSTNGSTAINPASQSRELLADTPGDGQIGSFTNLFERKSAVTGWEKFVHALGILFRRHWARQQVEKVLTEAKAQGKDGLESVKALKKEFDAKGKISESIAKAAADDLIRDNVIPDPGLGMTRDEYFTNMEAWYTQKLFNDDNTILGASSKAQNPHVRGIDALHQSAQHARGLKILIQFAQNPACAVSIKEKKGVQALMDHLKGNEADSTDHPGPPYHATLTEIYEQYIRAIEDAEQTVETSRQKLATPVMQRNKEDAESAAFAWLRNSPEFVHHPELITAFNKFIENDDRPTSPGGFIRSESQPLNQFLGRFALAFQKNPQELISLRPWVVALEDALLDRGDLEQIIDIHPDDKERKLLKGLDASLFSPSCVLALAEYLLVSRPAKSTGKPATSSVHAPRLNPESWMRLRYFYDQREEWQRSLPIGKTVETTANEVLRRLASDIAVFERGVIRPKAPKKFHSADNDDT